MDSLTRSTSANHIPDRDLPQQSTVFTFSLSDKPGALHHVIKKISDLGLNMNKIESRPGRASNSYDFFVEIELSPISPKVSELINSLTKEECINVRVVGGKSIPHFPRRPRDLDMISEKTLQCGEELDADHPGFTDPEYRKRRQEITAIAKIYKHGHSIPRIEYTDQEKETWRTVYLKLKQLYPTHACSQFNFIFPLLEQNCGYSENNIPQLEDISRFLQDCTGFSLRPVTGLLTSRDFLAGLAFRVFHSTQYIRHHSVPEYTPEPDICHELLGHVPLFADPDFALFSQEIGLASLGASEEEIKKLATLYWFTVEFGLCRQDGQLRAYGAGVLSSAGELKHALSGVAHAKDLNISEAVDTTYPITKYQPLYFVASSFQDATTKLREYVHCHMTRPFRVIYNPYTKTVEVVESTRQLVRMARDLASQIDNLATALQSI